jgi:hypothetical protein
MTDTITYSGVLTVVTCGTCQVSFALPEDLHRRALDDHDIWFWCPRGDKIHYLGPSKADRLADQLKWARRSEEFYREQAAAERRRAAAARGQVTKLRNRVARGVCPAAGCQRSFTDMHEHVATCHPELLHIVEEAS